MNLILLFVTVEVTSFAKVFSVARFVALVVSSVCHAVFEKIVEQVA